MSRKHRNQREILSLNWVLAASLSAASSVQPLLDSARKHYQSGDFANAILIYQQVVDKDSAHTAAWRELAQCMNSVGRTPEACHIWENLLRLDPRDRPTLNSLGYAQLSNGKYQAALDCFQRSLRLKGDQNSLRLRISEAYEGLGDLEHAAQSLDAFLRLEPHRTDAILRRALIQDRMGDSKGAMARLEKAIQTYPSTAKPDALRSRLYGAQGEVAYHLEDFSQACQYLETGLQWDESNIAIRIGLGSAQRRMNKPQQALETWSKVPKDAETPNLLRGRAEAYMELGAWDKAKSTLEQIRVIQPQEPSPCLQLFEVGLRLDQSALSTSAFAALMGIPGLEGTWGDRLAETFNRLEQTDKGVQFLMNTASDTPFRGRMLARLYAAQAAQAYQKDRVDEAIRLCKLALEQDATNRHALRDLGWAYAHQGDWKTCLATWRQLVAIQPDWGEAHDRLGLALLFIRDYDGAIQAEEKALTLDPTLKSAKVRLMQALAQDGRLQKAKELGTALSKEYPEDLAVHYRLAEVLTRSGEHMAAREVWNKLRKLDPDKLRPVQNWIRESYAVEDYAVAIAEARRLTITHPAPESALRFLALDAELTGHYEEAAEWMHRLTQEHPDMQVYWQDRIRYLQLAGRLDLALQVSAEGSTALPTTADLQILHAELLLAKGNRQEGLKEFRTLAQKYPGNLAAYQGFVNALMQNHEYREALDQLNGNRFKESFLSSYNRDLWRTEALMGLGDLDGARTILGTIAKSNPKQRYIPIILYHGIQEQERTPCITSAAFERQMAALTKNGYTAITLSEMELMIAGKQAWPSKPILITFDDARLDSFMKADPILARYGLKATMFVPTGEPAESAELFHASWQNIQRLSQNGRWEMQAHGHEAHAPIAIDAKGHLGKFLVERAWLPELNRVETDSEFQARLDEDYKRCRETLLQKIAPEHPIAFAFPYSEAGQLSVTGMDHAAEINSATWPKYFRFGMVQDSSGYNLIQEGESSSRLLWRFEPAAHWTGEELIRHLATENPTNRAKLQLANLTLWMGQTGRARTMLDQLEQESPGMYRACEAVRAEIAWADNRPREAAQHLAAYEAGLPPQSPRNTSSLQRRLEWENEAHPSAGGEFVNGSDHRSRSSAFLSYHWPLQGPVTFDVKVGALQYQERGLGHLNGKAFEGHASWAPTRIFDISGWGSFRRFDGDMDRKSAGINAHLGFDTHDFRMDLRREDMDTLASLRAGVRQWDGSLTYALRLNNWSVMALGSQASTSDHNRLHSELLQALCRPEGLIDWQFGFDLQKADSDQHSNLYYTPMNYKAARFKCRYQRSFMEDSSLTIDMAGGRSDDDINHQRWTGALTLDWSRLWSRNLCTNVKLGLGSTNGYASTQGAVTVGYRF